MIYVAEIEQRHQYAVTHVDGRYRLVLPVELCQHSHETIEAAIECGSPKAAGLMAVMNRIGESMLRELELESSNDDNT